MQPNGTQAGLEPGCAGGHLHRLLRGESVAHRPLPDDAARGMFARSKRGFYHDGRYPTLMSVVEHYDSCRDLNLTAREKCDLVEWVRSR
jgi:hypothetical protein